MATQYGTGEPNVLQGSNPTVVYDPRHPTSKKDGAKLYGFSSLNALSRDFSFEGTVSYNSNGDLYLNNGRIWTTNIGWYGNMTTSWWMKYEGSVNAAYFYTENFRGGGGCSRIYSGVNSNGTFYFQIWDNSSVSQNKVATSTTNVCDGNWHYITCVWQNTATAGIYLYVNGTQEAFTSFTGNDGSYESWHLGGGSGCVGEITHKCYLGPIHAFKSALTQAQIEFNYNMYKIRYR